MRHSSLLVVLFLMSISVGSAVAQEYAIPSDRVPSGLLSEELNGTLPGAADEGIKPRPIRQLALDLIKAFEGWSADLYDDPAGYCTLGYGHLIAKRKCATVADLKLRAEFHPILSLQTGNKLLGEDTRAARRTIQRLVTVELDNNQFGAVTAFVFNIGAANFSRSTMLKLLNIEQYDSAAKEMLKWTRANKVVLRGLVIRRQCEYDLFYGRARRLPNGLYDRDACTPTSGAATDLEDAIDIVSGEASK